MCCIYVPLFLLDVKWSWKYKYNEPYTFSSYSRSDRVRQNEVIFRNCQEIWWRNYRSWLYAGIYLDIILNVVFIFFSCGAAFSSFEFAFPFFRYLCIVFMRLLLCSNLFSVILQQLLYFLSTNIHIRCPICGCLYPLGLNLQMPISDVLTFNSYHYKYLRNDWQNVRLKIYTNFNPSVMIVYSA